MPTPTLNIGFNKGPRTLVASTGKYGILRPQTSGVVAGGTSGTLLSYIQSVIAAGKVLIGQTVQWYNNGSGQMTSQFTSTGGSPGDWEVPGTTSMTAVVNWQALTANTNNSPNNWYGPVLAEVQAHIAMGGIAQFTLNIDNPAGWRGGGAPSGPFTNPSGTFGGDGGIYDGVSNPNPMTSVVLGYKNGSNQNNGYWIASGTPTSASILFNVNSDGSMPVSPNTIQQQFVTNCARATTFFASIVSTTTGLPLPFIIAPFGEAQGSNQWWCCENPFNKNSYPTAAQFAMGTGFGANTPLFTKAQFSLLYKMLYHQIAVIGGINAVWAMETGTVWDGNNSTTCIVDCYPGFTYAQVVGADINLFPTYPDQSTSGILNGASNSVQSQFASLATQGCAPFGGLSVSPPNPGSSNNFTQVYQQVMNTTSPPAGQSQGYGMGWGAIVWFNGNQGLSQGNSGSSNIFADSRTIARSQTPSFLATCPSK